MRLPCRLIMMLGLALLCACGGGGSSTPSTSLYTIGGSVSGLTANSGVVLLNNGGDALDVPVSAASFTFSSSIASGAAYAVTVQTEPTGETCTVTNGSGMAGGNVTSVSVMCASNFAAGGANVVPMSVNAGPASSAYQIFNIAFVTVKVCQGATCASIPNVLVDTGSSGLRLMASVLATNGLSSPTLATLSGNSLYECLPYADGYSWGGVANVTVTIGQETTSSAVPMQIIDDIGGAPQAPGSCATGTSLDSVNALDANGTLGVSVFTQDCGSACTSAGNGIYFVCPGGTGTCSSPAVLASEQVSNPVASLPTDNNGVILQLPAISAAGAATASGYLVLGIGTESNNALSGVNVLTTNAAGDFTTNFSGQVLPNSFIDSGSNALYFPNTNPQLALCANSGALANFYCPANSPPATPLSLMATNEGQNGTTSDVTFPVADLISISDTNFAIDDVAGPAPSSNKLTSYFDWGLPLFYGRTVYVAIEGLSAGGSTGPYYAY